MNKEIMFETKVKRVEQGLCPLCNKKPGEFRDAVSKREFTISGMCQKCQDEVFRPLGDDE